MYRILGILILGAALSLIAIILKDDNKLIALLGQNPATTCEQRTPAQQLSLLIKNDFDHLLKNKELPAEWSQISSINFQMNSTLAKALLGKHRPRFKQIQNGAYFMEIEVMDLPDDNDPGIILQISLFEIKSQNKVFEIGRTYTMNQLNNVEPSKKEQEL